MLTLKDYSLICKNKVVYKEQNKMKNMDIKRCINNIKYILSMILKYKKKYLIVLFITTIFTSILPYISLFNTQRIVNLIQLKSTDFNSITINIILFIVIGILSIGLTNLQSNWLSKYKEYLYYELNAKILQETKKYNLCDFENPRIYDMLQRAEQEIGVRPINIISNLLTITSSIISFLTSLIILFSWHSWAIVGFLFLPFIASKYFASISKNEYKVVFNRTNYERKSWYIAHLLTKDQYIKEVKLLNLFDYLLNLFKKLRKKFFIENVKLINKKSLFSILYQLSNFLITVSLVIVAFIEAFFQKILVGNLMTYINTTSKVETAIKSIVGSLFTFYQDGLFVENIKNFFEYSSSKENIVKKKIHIDKITSVELTNVSYRYPNRKEYALKNINLKLEKGEIVALVGENGSGKTTLIKLLNNLYTNYEGTILINGINIKEINNSDLKEKISTVLQDFNQFQFTIKENIGFGDINNLNDMNKIKQASKMSSANKFIELLPNAYEQQVGYWFEGGTQLSGGQWQKLAISRIFMKGGDFFILDEPTAALDPKAEYEFFENFKSNINDRIGLFITHRFINAKFTKKIIVLDKGKIIEQGSHEELIKLNGIYKKMYDFQVR